MRHQPRMVDPFLVSASPGLMPHRRSHASPPLAFTGFVTPPAVPGSVAASRHLGDRRPPLLPQVCDPEYATGPADSSAVEAGIGRGTAPSPGGGADDGRRLLSRPRSSWAFASGKHARRR